MTNTEFKAMNDEELAMVAGGSISDDFYIWVKKKTHDALGVLTSEKAGAVASLLKNAHQISDIVKEGMIKEAKDTVKGWFTS